MIHQDLSFYASVAGIAVATYAWLVLVLRIAGKRSLAKLNAFDFVVTVALGSVLATVIVSQDVDWMTGAVCFTMLALLQYVVSKASVWSPWLHDAVRSRPTVLVRDGQLLDQALAGERVTRSEIEASVRGAGYGQLSQVAAVVLETDGSFSVIPRDRGPVDLLTDVRND